MNIQISSKYDLRSTSLQFLSTKYKSLAPLHHINRYQIHIKPGLLLPGRLQPPDGRRPGGGPTGCAGELEAGRRGEKAGEWLWTTAKPMVAPEQLGEGSLRRTSRPMAVLR